MQQLQGQGIGSVELWVILPMVIYLQRGLCFSLVMGPYGCLLGSSDLPFLG
jgi:hypothetical protein